MAQPQHVRNDVHLTVDDRCSWSHILNNPFTADPSYYEAYTNDNRNSTFFARALNSLPYGPVRFDTARKYWTTGREEGIADFTNRNFLSKDTNFTLNADNTVAQNSRYSRPFPNGVERTVSLQARLQQDGTCPGPSPACLLQGDLTFYGTDIFDAFKNATTKNDEASTLSIFNEDLAKYNAKVVYADSDDPFSVSYEYERLFTLNRFNFQAGYEHLIPKAVAYGAGLIDYFFRGRLAAEDVIFTDTGISLRVKNEIDAVKTPAWANEKLYAANGSSSLVVAYEYKDAAGIQQYKASPPVAFVDSEIVPGQVSTQSYDFNVSIPTGATDTKYRLVFRGKLGQEADAVAVGAIEPTGGGFVVTPNYIPADGIEGSREIIKREGKWELTDRSNPRAGNIDWKGWYVAGKATRVLSWHGPRSRYFAENLTPSNPYLFKDVIYEDGTILGYTPSPVLGAAVMQDDSGAQWVIAICWPSSGLETVYQRPYKKNFDRRLFDPINNPDGWKEITSVSVDSNLNQTVTPWFFNGSGSEAQTIRWEYEATTDGSELPTPRRLKWNYGAATIADLKNTSSGWETGEVIGSGISIDRVPPPPFPPCGTYVAYNNQNSSGTIRTSLADYILAVDYKDNQEIFAVFRGMHQQNDNENYAERQEVNVECRNGIPFYSNTTFYSEVKEGARVIKDEYSASLGSTDLVLYSRSYDLHNKNTQGINESTFELTLSDVRTERTIVFFDLRHDVLVYRTTTVTFLNFGNNGNCDGSYTTEETLQIKSPGRVLTVYDESNVNAYTPRCMPFWSGSLPASDVTPPDTQQFVELPPGVAYPRNEWDGSWVVDTSGNLFVSQDYRTFLEDIYARRHFSYLTGAPGGRPDGVIPGAGSEPTYYPVGVVK